VKEVFTRLIEGISEIKIRMIITLWNISRNVLAPTWAAKLVIFNCWVDDKEQSKERLKKIDAIFSKIGWDQGREEKLLKEKKGYDIYQRSC
jgi:hypothetical protein